MKILLFFVLSINCINAQKLAKSTSTFSVLFSEPEFNIEEFNSNVKNSLKSVIGEFTITAIFPSLDIYRLEYYATFSNSEKIIKWMNKSLGIRLFEDYKLENREIPNDTEFSEQWALDLIQATKVWDYTTGGSTSSGKEIVVAVIDDGFDVEHLDLVDNIWHNEKEDSGDRNADGCPGKCGVDDDGDGLIDEDAFGVIQNDVGFDVFAIADDDENGFIDDMIGADVRNRNGLHQIRTHGTKVAGIIGAKGNNNLGVSGVNWDIKLMLLSNTRRISDLILAYNYILGERKLFNTSNGDQGSYVVATNLSSGIDGRFAEDFPLWCDVYDILGAEGILNVCSTTNNDTNVDLEGDMPSTCSSEYLIAVNNSTQDDELYFSTGKSPMHIDLSAPGEGSYSLSQNNGYGPFGGTSASAPHVAGAIALLYSTSCEKIDELSVSDPGQVAISIRNAIINGVDKKPSFEQQTLSGGRLNIFNSLEELGTLCENTNDDFSIIGINKIGFSSYRLIYETLAPDASVFQIHDIKGALIYSQNVKPNLFGQKSIDFDLSNPPSGIYVATLIQNGAQNSIRFMHISS